MRTVHSVLSDLFDFQDWRGECYECGVAAMIACRTACVGDDLKLVQGEPVNRGIAAGERYGHCWLEQGDKVYDLTIQRHPIPKELYYLMGRIEEDNVRRYDYESVSKWCRDTEHYGPWEGPFGVPKRVG